jgi:Holliday junction resolvase-like predicted endonuclease
LWYGSTSNQSEPEEQVVYKNISQCLKTRDIEIEEVHRSLKTIRGEFDIVAINNSKKYVIIVEVDQKRTRASIRLY